jgi:RimJ/RimL family protein N-acetyltransferase
VIVIKRTHDMDLVHMIWTNSRLFKYMCDDYSNNPALYTPVDSPYLYYLVPYINDKPMGVILFIPNNSITYQVHIGMLPRFWGKMTQEACELTIEWLKANTACKKIMSLTPVNNKIALALAKRCGFVQQGVLTKSILMNGQLIDQVLTGKEL